MAFQFVQWFGRDPASFWWAALGVVVPHDSRFVIVLGPAIALAFWLVLSRTRAGRPRFAGSSSLRDARCGVEAGG